MLSSSQKEEVRLLIKRNLDRAENVWEGARPQFRLKLAQESLTYDSVMLKAEVQPSSIPGHKLVSDDQSVVDTFIAFVADIRDSTKHLMHEISAREASVSRLQRVYYETTALLPALAKTVEYEGGSVTEYLGDGILALFKVTTPPKTSIYSAHDAAKNCIGDTLALVNDALYRRYGLPPLRIGIGMACSQALVTLIGLDGEKHPKAIGECVFRASKISKGNNTIAIDKWIRREWPTVTANEKAKVRFVSKSFGDEDAYLVTRIEAETKTDC